jgi:type VI secretion system secreted protein Hcp
MAIYAKITGQKQGALKGGVAADGYVSQIQINTCEVGLGSPYDHGTGQTVGKRVPRPVLLTKPLDCSSPLLYTSCSTNESLTVEISYTVEGVGLKPFFTVKLTGAMLRDFDHESSYDGTGVEKLSFTYTKIEVTWTEGGIMASDDWTGAS